MADTFTLEIVTPSGPVLEAEVETVVAPGAAGEFGVLAGHSLLMTPLKIGSVSYTAEGTTSVLAVGRGFAEVLPDKTTILVETAVAASEIDVAEARQAAADLEAALGELSQDDSTRADKEDALELARVKVLVSTSSKD